MDELLQRVAYSVEKLAGQQLPVALAILAAILATLLFIKAQSAGGARGRVEVKKKEKKTFSKEDVAAHNKEDDVWIILNGKVYDVTPYVEEHPGGKAILRNAGADSTTGFHGPQHPDRVFDLIEDFYIGDLALS